MVHGTKGLWDELSMVRMVYTWYEWSVVRKYSNRMSKRSFLLEIFVKKIFISICSPFYGCEKPYKWNEKLTQISTGTGASTRQVNVWCQSHIFRPDLIKPIGHGWHQSDSMGRLPTLYETNLHRWKWETSRICTARTIAVKDRNANVPRLACLVLTFALARWTVIIPIKRLK